jgi:hypothetical protein
MKTRVGQSVVRVSVRPSNRGRFFLLDIARRQVDHLGPYGIKAKRGQTDERFRERGYIRLVFPNHTLAKRYVQRVERLGEPAVRCRLMRNPNRSGR